MNFLIGSYSSIRLAGATPRCHVLSDTAHTMSTRGGKRGGGPPPPVPGHRSSPETCWNLMTG